MKLKVRSSTIVPPIIGTPKMEIWNSNVDLVVPRIHVASVYFYLPNPRPDYFASEIMREAIGKALVPFHPMGGRLMRDATGRIAINSDGQGVLFVEAEADAKIADLGNFAPQPALQELVPKIEPTDDITSYPLLLLQVTRFKCGGAAFGVGMQHHVADGVSGIQFINSISYFARGAEVKVTPFLDRTVLKARNPPNPTFPHIEYQPAPALLPALAATGVANGHGAGEAIIKSDSKVNSVENGGCHGNGATAHLNGDAPAAGSELHGDAAKAKFKAGEKGDHGINELKLSKKVEAEPPMAVALFVFPREKLAVLKKRALQASSEKPYSSYEMLSAQIWKSMTLARKLSGPQPTKLYIATEGRARLVPPLPKDYFGNVVFTSTPMSTAEEIIGKPLSSTAGVIHSAVARMDDNYLRSALDYLELQPDKTKLVRGAHTFRAPNLGITSWARMPLYDCDFGWGRPIFMGPAHIAYDGLVYVLPSPVNDGSLTLSLGLREDYMDKFKELIMDVDSVE